MRNYVFGITPNTKRKIIKGRYQLNRRALERLLEVASKDGVIVIAYIVPLRNDAEIPYLPAEYEMYKSDMESLVKDSGHYFVNIEQLVPGIYWGTKEATTVGGEAELDFMHFQAQGHMLLADELYKNVLEHL